MQTKFFKHLLKQVRKLRNELLTSKPSVALPVPNQTSHIRAFVVFIHAEFEYYFEEVIKELVECTKLYYDGKIYSESTLAMLVYSADKKTIYDNHHDMRTKMESIKTALYQAASVIVKLCDENNGIRCKNLLKLVVPLGFNHTHVGSIFMADLDSYGSKRGEYVHTTNSILNIGTAHAEYMDAVKIIRHIQKFDKKVYAMM
jgi:hypothetical protein